MPYARRYRKRSRRYRRRGKMGRIMRTLGSIRAPEKKYFDLWFNPRTGLRYAAPYAVNQTDSSVVRLNTTWNTVSLLTLLGQGFSDTQRIGNEVFVKYVQLAVYVTTIASLDHTADPDTNNIIAANGMLCRYNLMKVKTNNFDLGNNYMDSVAPTGTGPNIFNVGQFKSISIMRNYKTLLDAQHQAHVTQFSVATEPTPSFWTSGTRVIQHFLKVNRRARFGTDRSGSTTMNDSSNLSTLDLRFGACANINDCCDMQVHARICFTDA